MEQLSLFEPRPTPAARDPGPSPGIVRLAPRGPEFLADLDRRFADFLLARGGSESEEVWLGAALASHAASQGRACVDLRDVAGRPWQSELPPAVGQGTAPELAKWIAALSRSCVVGSPGDLCPLVLDGDGRLYLHRYWRYEQRLAEQLLARAARPAPDVDLERLRRDLALVHARLPLTDEQRVAAATAVLRHLTIVSGGAGTGKTTIIACILRLLAQQSSGRLFRACLAAPTGKAANRLREQIESLRATIDPEGTLDTVLRDPPATLHRLLGGTTESTQFRHHARNPLALDALIVDETSMIDIALMAKLVDALPAHARLVLVGDRDQLPPVEVGSVLGEICGQRNAFTAEFRATLESATGLDLAALPSGDGPLADTTVLLTKSQRFAPDSGIGALAAAVRSGEPGTLAQVAESSFADLAWHEAADPRQESAVLRDAIRAGFAPFLAAIRSELEPRTILHELGRFRLLCAHRDGPWGVSALNELVERLLGRGVTPEAVWYPGRPVMVTRNDYNLKLFNGDVGVALSERTGDGRLLVWFEGLGGKLRSFPPGRLSNVETAFAITVHKSQGSEFDGVLLVLPGAPSRLMTRELLYTAVTRARSKLTIFGPRARLAEGIARRLPRGSGLREALTRLLPATATSSRPGC